VFATVGLPEEIATFTKSYSTVLNSLTAARGFDQITMLLDFTNLLRDIKEDPKLMLHPLSQFADTAVRRTFFEWVKEKFGSEQPQEQNKKILEQFLVDFIPVCDEVRELRHSVKKALQSTLITVERELNRIEQ